MVLCFLMGYVYMCSNLEKQHIKEYIVIIYKSCTLSNWTSKRKHENKMFLILVEIPHYRIWENGDVLSWKKGYKGQELCEPAWPSGQGITEAGGRTSARFCFGSFSSKVVVRGHRLVTLSPTIRPNEALKWLSSLLILWMKESFWCWQCSDRYIISLSHSPGP